MKTLPLIFALVATTAALTAADPKPTLIIDTPMPAPGWAKLERRLLSESVPVTRAFVQKYFDDRGYLQCFVRWGANDGPDDAFENFRQWPELHALGASDEVIQLYLKTWEGMLRQYSEAKTVDVPAGRGGMYYKDFSAQSDWMHHGEGMQSFVRMGLSVPDLPNYQRRARVYAALYMDEDPEAPNYDPKLKLIRSMMNGSRGPMLRKATALEWVGDPFDVKGFDALHGEDTFEQFLAHYNEYGDVVGDHFLNLVATTLPATAYLVTGEAKYKDWVVGYMDAWLERMKQNKGVIPSYVALDGKIGGPEGKWWNNAYGWGFSPVNPVNGRRENRNRIPRAVIGFNSALLLTGDQKYVDAWRTMMDAVNANARTVNGRTEYPTMYGADGWYGWQAQPWSVGALEVWYGSMKPSDLARAPQGGWVSYLQGKDANFPETALQRDLETVARKAKQIADDTTPPAKRLADNMLNKNPATTGALVQLMWGGIPPGNDGSMVNSRLRYFDPVRRRAGVPEDVGALISELTDTRTVVTLVNLSATETRTVIVQGGAYGEHRIESIDVNGKSQPVGRTDFSVQLAPGAGAKLTLTMRRFASQPTVKFPWARG
jgi:hypothetical protein